MRLNFILTGVIFRLWISAYIFYANTLAIFKRKLDNKSTKTKTVKQTKYKNHKEHTDSATFKSPRSYLNRSKKVRVFLYCQNTPSQKNNSEQVKLAYQVEF